MSFCDASARYCTDIHVLGTAQLTSAGTATLILRPGIGSHNYKAEFLGTNVYAASTSKTSPLTVAGQYTTKTTLTPYGPPGSYSLTATVSGIINAPGVPAPTGSISFVDTTNNNSLLGDLTLSSGTAELSLSSSLAPMTLSAGMGIATADFNQDGIPDLAVGAMNGLPGVLDVLLGKGDGTFTPAPANPTVGNYPYSVATGDFNGDGIPDLAAGNVEDNDVSILIGIGDGTFTAKAGPNIGGEPQWLAISDFNGDGVLDMAVVTRSFVAVFLGNGDGTFKQVPGNLAVQSPLPQGIAAGDINGDGLVDLVVANDVEPGSLTIYFGNGDGTFKSGTQISGTGNGTISVAIADLNGDGISDLTVSNYDDQTVGVLLGNGDGTFHAPAISKPLGRLLLQSVTPADFDGDGNVDLAIGSGYSSAIVLPGNGDGTFGSPVYGGVSSIYPSGFLAVADFNGDGRPDMAEADQTGADAAIILDQPSETVTAILNNVNLPGPGTQQVTANYPGDSIFSGSVSSAVALTPKVETPQINLASGTFETPQTLTLTDATPGATIYYYASGIVNTAYNYIPYVGPIALTKPGNELIRFYASETGYQDSFNATANYTIDHFTPSVTITPAPSSITTAQSLSVTVAMGAVGGNATPTGTVMLVSGSFKGQQVLAAGSATFNIPAGVLPIGTDTLTATYTPDAASSGVYGVATQSSAVTVSALIGTAASTISVTPSSSDVTDAQMVTVAVAISGTKGMPTGSVTLSSGNWSSQQMLSGGSVQFTIPAGTLSTGTDTLTAKYSGDSIYAVATGTSSITVSSVIATVQTPSAVSPGETATSDFSLSAGSGYSGTMTLTCALKSAPSGAQSLPTCIVKPTSVTVIAQGRGTATISIATIGASNSAEMRKVGSPFRWLGSGGVALATVLFLGIPARRRKLLMFALLPAVFAFPMLGCGGSGSSGGGPTISATTAGSYTFTVTGADTVNPRISTSATFVVTVQ